MTDHQFSASRLPIDSPDLCKYPAEFNIDFEAGEFKKGDIVTLIDKDLGINGTYKVTKINGVDELETVKLKFIKINK